MNGDDVDEESETKSSDDVTTEQSLDYSSDNIQIRDETE